MSLFFLCKDLQFYRRCILNVLDVYILRVYNLTMTPIVSWLGVPNLCKIKPGVSTLHSWDQPNEAGCHVSKTEIVDMHIACV